jgi:Transglycosylase SLT domain
VKPMDAERNTSMRVIRVAWAAVFLSAGPVVASVDPAALCDGAAIAASETSGVPADVLRALTRTETGRASGGALQPWPWAINQAGEGAWFATRDDMLDHIRGLVSAGATNFDVGCFQLNYRWHATGFASLEDMADPGQNAHYAAGFLAQKYAASGDWGQAAAAYHSGTPELAARYRTRFSEIYASLDPRASVAGPPVQEPDHPNLFPLLIAGRSGGGGSLVPMTAKGRSLFGGDE